jgi:chromate transporter
MELSPSQTPNPNFKAPLGTALDVAVGLSNDEEGATSEKSGPGVEKPTICAVAKAFVVLGWTAFGGPQAHLALFHAEFVDGRRWVSEQVFLELIALGSCLPGPTSTQVSFALGVVITGTTSGGLLTGVLFQYPGLIMLTALGFAFEKALESPAAWLLGLCGGMQAGGVALIWLAAHQLSIKVCTSPWLQSLGCFSGVVAYYHPKPYTFPALIAFGGCVSYAIKSKEAAAAAGTASDPSANTTRVSKGDEVPEEISSFGLGLVSAGVLLAAWAATLVGVSAWVGQAEYTDATKHVFWFEAAYRTGSLIFGGGQVVLPLLMGEVLEGRGRPWMTEAEFLTGIAAAQAMPGPLFNLAAYLGAVVGGVGGALTWWVGLFSPGVLLIFGVLPFWGKFRHVQAYRRALPGLNASAVGLVFAAAFQLLFAGLGAASNAGFDHSLVCIGMAAFHLVANLKTPAPAAIALGGVVGAIARAAGAN